ncbi:LysR family transcriptional regulator [Streptomyces sp. NPDC050560]|uniref:LysR family transcriptional regulator n=1 Tax=Streptomyces sp. NPDC050560 TaxID=3365630 RepID=UPI0037A07BDE
MELKHLATFLAVARTLGFTRAAHELGYVQSSVTAHVKALETELGVPLFERFGRRVALTEAGRELRGHARELLALAARAGEATRAAGGSGGEVGGTLRIAAAESLCAYRLPTVLRTLTRRHPALRLAFGPAERAAVFTALADGALDAGFLLEERIEAPLVAARRLAEEPLALVAHPGHPLAGRAGIAAAELADDTLLVVERGCALRELADAELAGAVTDPVVMEFVSMEALKRCAAAGLGVALVPRATVRDELARGELTALDWRLRPGLGVYLVTGAGRGGPRALAELASLAAEMW